MLMRNMLPEYAIRGDCSFFACGCCRTKYGWEHQAWCEVFYLTDPNCTDCFYHHPKTGSCVHPAMKNNRKENFPREENQRPVRTGQNG